MAVKVWNTGDRPGAADVNRWEIGSAGAIPGLVSDGVFDCTALIQARINSLGANGGLVRLPPGNNRITTPLQVNTNGVIFQGSGLYRSRIYSDGCNGLEVAAGVSDLQMFDVELAAKTRYSTTANSQVGVKINGTSASHAQNFVFRNVLADGFKTGFYCKYLWGSVFDNCRTVYGLQGLVSYGLSVNNQIIGGALNVDGAGSVAGSRCIALLGYEDETLTTPVASEGWIVKPTLADGGEIAVEIAGNAHIEVGGILDHCGLHGVLIRDNGVNFGGNCDIHPTYVAMATTAGVAAIRNANTVANSALKRTRVHHTLLTVYTGASCTYGINQSGNNGLLDVDGNSAKGFTTADFFAQSAGNILGTNDFQSAIANNVSGTPAALTCVSGSNGHVWVPGASGNTSPFAYSVQGNRKVAPWYGPPTTGTWAVADLVPNLTPASGPPGWVCTVAGTPGTWVALSTGGTSGGDITVQSTTTWPARPATTGGAVVVWQDTGALGTTPPGAVNGDRLFQ